MTEQFKVLSYLERKNIYYHGKGTLEAVAEAQLKDTLRQVVVMLDGLENPHKHVMIERNTPPCLLTCRACLWESAIQTIKQSLQQAIEEAQE